MHKYELEHLEKSHYHQIRQKNERLMDLIKRIIPSNECHTGLCKLSGFLNGYYYKTVETENSLGHINRRSYKYRLELGQYVPFEFQCMVKIYNDVTSSTSPEELATKIGEILNLSDIFNLRLEHHLSKVEKIRT